MLEQITLTEKYKSWVDEVSQWIKAIRDTKSKRRNMLADQPTCLYSELFENFD